MSFHITSKNSFIIRAEIQSSYCVIKANAFKIIIIWSQIWIYVTSNIYFITKTDIQNSYRVMKASTFKIILSSQICFHMMWKHLFFRKAEIHNYWYHAVKRFPFKNDYLTSKEWGITPQIHDKYTFFHTFLALSRESTPLACFK